MALSSNDTRADVIKAVGDVLLVTSSVQTEDDLNELHCGKEWAKVATAFFKNCSNPTWLKFDAAEAAFAAAAGKSINAASFASAWSAYITASLAVITNLSPGGVYENGDIPTPVYISPLAPPIFPKMMVSPPANDHKAAAKNLYDDLVTWASTGTVAATTPTTPPTPSTHQWD